MKQMKPVGMSEKAWDWMHEFVARMEVKYQGRIKNNKGA